MGFLLLGKKSLEFLRLEAPPSWRGRRIGSRRRFGACFKNGSAHRAQRDKEALADLILVAAIDGNRRTAGEPVSAKIDLFGMRLPPQRDAFTGPRQISKGWIGHGR